MKREISMTKILDIATLAILLAISGNVIGQQQPRSVSHPSTSSVQVTPRTPSSRYGSAIGAQTGMKVAKGAITGYVYWDMSGFKAPSSCQGLSAQVSTVTVSKVSPQVLATAGTFTQVGPPPRMCSPRGPEYTRCFYSINKIPVRLLLKFTVSPPSAPISPFHNKQ